MRTYTALESLSESLGLPDDWFSHAHEGVYPAATALLRAGEFIAYYLANHTSHESAVNQHLGRLITFAMVRQCQRGRLSADERTLFEYFLTQTRTHWQTYVLEHFGESLAEGEVSDFIHEALSPAGCARAQLARAFGLRFPSLQWAATNADADRLGEFLDYFKRADPADGALIGALRNCWCPRLTPGWNAPF